MGDQQFLRFWLLLVAGLLWGSLGRQALAADPIEVHLSYLGDKADTAFLGVFQGLQEAKLQGQFLGQTYILHKRAVAEVIQAKDPKSSAFLTAVDPEALKKLSALHPGVPIFNLILEDEELRALCLPNVLHIIPSRQMRQDAVMQWRKLYPKAQVVAQAWHPEFEKYAAKQLNNRFTKTTGQPMDDRAWAGWAAVKMLADTVARKRTADPAELLKYLKTELAFDGQKGIEMSFRPTGQLRQILLVVEQGRIVGEAPVKGVVDPMALDSLGLADCPR